MERKHVPGYWRRHFAALFRWLHIYLSMASFAILFFFAVTGLTLNHSEWFDGAASSRTLTGQVKPAWLDPVDELGIVEFLRREHRITGAVGEFRSDEIECDVSFRGPGYSADVFIDRESGDYEITENRLGLVAVLNDLHKGRDSGTAWSWVIDLSAVLMVLVSLTGMVLICFLKRRRFTGLVAAAAGAVLCGIIYKIFVP